MATVTLEKNKSEIDFIAKLENYANQTRSPLSFIANKQEEALKQLKKIGFPNKSNEDWKYFDLSEILKADYQIQGALKPNKEELEKYKNLVSQYIYTECQNSLLVTINGRYSEELSNLSAFDTNAIEILDFNNPEEINSKINSKEITEKYFAKNINDESDFFKLANTILMKNGFLLNLKDNFQSEKSLQILHISNEGTFNQTRSLIHLGKNSELNMVVDYIGLNYSKYFTNAVIEIILEENSKVKLDKTQNESKSAIQLYNLNAELKRDSRFELNLFSFGGLCSRNNINVDINGENSEAVVNGLYVTSEKRKSHNLIFINHNVPHARSEQLFKGLLYDESKAEFNGTVNVKKDAQQTFAEQLNRNLLISDKAEVETRPQLNIFADDVKCSHGATIGQLEEDELFYLESRGISKEEATTLLTYSFCEELIQKVKLKSARDLLSELAVRNLNKGIVSLENLSTGKRVNRESKKWKR